MFLIMSRSLSFPDLSFRIDRKCESRENAEAEIERYVAADRLIGANHEYVVAKIEAFTTTWATHERALPDFSCVADAS